MRSCSKPCGGNRSAATSAQVRWPTIWIGFSRAGRWRRGRRDADIAPANSSGGIASASRWPCRWCCRCVGGLAATAWQARAKTLEAQKAEAVKAFLISIFQGADPVQAAGRDITLRQVLDEGAERVQRDLASQPAVQGELLTVLAGIYAELGVTERAAALTDQALDIHERLHGADSALVGTNLRQKASLAIARGDADTRGPLRARGPGEASACVRQPASGRGRGSGCAADRGAPARPAGRRAIGRRGIAAHPESALRQRASAGCGLDEQPGCP